jgi:hypothetical protein
MLERFIAEGKHFIIHDLFSWRQTRTDRQIIEFFEEKREEVLSTFKVFIVRRNPSRFIEEERGEQHDSVINLAASATTMKSLCLDLITLEKRVVYNTTLGDRPSPVAVQTGQRPGPIHENSTLRKNSLHHRREASTRNTGPSTTCTKYPT